jgi:hypothetical protein
MSTRVCVRACVCGVGNPVHRRRRNALAPQPLVQRDAMGVLDVVGGRRLSIPYRFDKCSLVWGLCLNLHVSIVVGVGGSSGCTDILIRFCDNDHTTTHHTAPHHTTEHTHECEGLGQHSTAQHSTGWLGGIHWFQTLACHTQPTNPPTHPTTQ